MFTRTDSQTQGDKSPKGGVLQRSRPAKRPVTQRQVLQTFQRIRNDPKSITQNDVMQLQSTIGNRKLYQLLTSQIYGEKNSGSENNHIRQNKGKENVAHSAGENNAGLPAQLKTGLESLSSIDLSDVKVHYNSSKPKNVGALAYTKGSDIHIGPGQEKFLPHEGWHAVQQKQGRVNPTLKMKPGVEVNDNAELEKEADIMGGKATTVQKYSVEHQVNEASYLRPMPLQSSNTIQRVPLTSLFDLKSDWAGREILSHYLFGGGKDIIKDNDTKWTEYMKANRILTNKVKKLVKAYASQVEYGSSKDFCENTSMEIDNGEQIIGYQYLHGTNADVGGFEISGVITKDEDGDSTITFSYQWNDRIDPNFIYDSDSEKAKFAKSIPLAEPTDYTIRISWTDTSILSCEGIFLSGWLSTYEPRPKASRNPSNREGR